MSALPAAKGRDLPDGWRWATMGDIAEVVGGGTPRTSDPANFDGGEIPWVTPADLSGYTEKYISHGSRFITRNGLESSAARLLPAGTVLFSSRAPIGYVAIARNAIATNQGFKSFVISDGVLPEYVYWWLKGSKQIAENLASGTTFLEISGTSAKKIPIPIAPIAQQQEIVTEIEKQFSRIDEAEASIKHVEGGLTRYKAAVLNAAVEGRLVPTETEVARREGRSYETGAQVLQRILGARSSQWKGRGAYRDPASPDSTDWSKTPPGWTWGTIEQLAILVTDGDHNPPKRHTTGVPHLTAKNVRDWRLDLTDCTYIDSSDADRVFKRYRPLAGDLIVTSVGTIGRTAIVPPGLEFSPDRNLAAIRPVARGIDVEFLNLVLSSPKQQKILLGASGSTAQPHLYLGDLRSIVVPVPPLAEQRRIVAEVERRLSIADEVLDGIRTNIRRGNRLRKVVLRQAFG